MSVQMKIKTRDDVKKVIRAKRRGEPKTLGRVGAITRGAMKRTLGRPTKKPRAPGRPMSSPTKRAKKGILFSVNERRGVVQIGPSIRMVGLSANAHEFGKNFKGNAYEARPFAKPTIEQMAPKAPRFWANSLKE